MGSAGQAKVVAIFMQLAVLLVAATAAAEKNNGPNCIGRTDQVPVANSCICSSNCACAGKCILSSQDFPDVKSCFINCVLRNGCNSCTGDGEAADGTAPPPGLPATLDKTLRVTVPRSMVSTSIPEEEEEELLFEIAFDPSVRGITAFQVQLNSPKGQESVKYNKHLVEVINSVKDDEQRTGKAVRRYPIGSKLKDLGADGDKTIEVSFVPVPSKTGLAPTTTIRDVRVVYHRKK